MKASAEFRNIIETHLREIASMDSAFNERFMDSSKSLDECISYILETVMKSGVNGFADDEVYSIAIHYYMEDVKAESIHGCKVIVNHHVELSEEEKSEIRRKAKDDCYKAELERLRKPRTRSGNVQQNNAGQADLLFSFD